MHGLVLLLRGRMYTILIKPNMCVSLSRLLTYLDFGRCQLSHTCVQSQDIFGILTNGNEWAFFRFQHGNPDVNYECRELSVHLGGRNRYANQVEPLLSAMVGILSHQVRRRLVACAAKRAESKQEGGRAKRARSEQEGGAMKRARCELEGGDVKRAWCERVHRCVCMGVGTCSSG